MIRFRKWAAILCMAVCAVGWMAPAWADQLTEMEMYFAQDETYSGFMDVPGRGQMRYYAQNDPLWGELIYERANSGKSRVFRNAGCGPTACAMAIAAVVPEEELPSIIDFGIRPFSLCSCSLNKSRCFHRHVRYVLTTPRDFARFLPLVFGDFAAGNNTHGEYSRSTGYGTNSRFYHYIAEAYGVELTVTHDFSAAVAATQSGDAVVANAGTDSVFTNSGHYIFLASVDEEKAYFLDPLLRDVYKTHNAKRLEIIQPGLVALPLKFISSANFGSFFIFHRNAE